MSNFVVENAPPDKNGLLIPNIAHEIIVCDFDDNYNLQILRCADKCKLKCIMFKSDIIQSIDNFKQQMRNAKFKLLFKTDIIAEYNFSLMMELNEVKKIENDFVITIPNDYTFDKILLTSLDFTDVDVHLDIECKDKITDVKLLVDYIYCDKTEQYNLHDNIQNTLYQEITKCATIDLQPDKIRAPCRLNDNGIGQTKGYFIEGNISKINSFTIRHNGKDRFNHYDKTMIDICCYKITDRLMYFSYNGKNNYKDMNLNSYNGSLNTLKIDLNEMMFNFDQNTEQEYFNIYSISLKYINYIKGYHVISYSPLSTLPETFDIRPSHNYIIREREKETEHETDFCQCLNCNTRCKYLQPLCKCSSKFMYIKINT